MQVSSRFSIALHIFACIGYFQNDCKITSDFLATSICVNPVIIRKIMSQLSHAGLVNVARGTGGITLARSADEITFRDVFNAVEALDGGKLFHFHENPNTDCPVGASIHRVLDDKLDRVQRAMEDELARITIADVIRDTHMYAPEQTSPNPKSGV